MTKRVAGLILGIVGILAVAAIAFVVFEGPVMALQLVQREDPTSVGGGRHGIVLGAGSESIGKARLLQTLGDPAKSGLKEWPEFFDAPPKAFDLNGDGVDELMALSNDTNVYVFDVRSGRVLAKLPTTLPDEQWFMERVLNGVEAGRLRPGEAPSIVVTNHAAFVTAWKFVSGDSKSFKFEKSWQTRMDDPCRLDPSMDAKPVLADANGDGSLEIFVQNEEEGLYALRPDGTLLWSNCWAGGNSNPIVEDLEGDGKPEAIFASDSGFVAVFDAASGKPKWTFDAADPSYGITPASITVNPTVAQLDGKGPREILFTARHAPSGDPTKFKDYHMAIFAIHQGDDGKGALLWMTQPEWAHPLSYTRLVVQDIDGDGAMDIFGMDWNTIGHKPGNWEPLGLAHAFRLDAQGNEVWMKEIDAWWSNKDIAIGDADHDGVDDLFLNGAYNGSDGIYIMSAKTGALKGFLPAWPWKLMRGAILTDLRHDGSVQAVYPVTPDDPVLRRGAILVVELG